MLLSWMEYIRNGNNISEKTKKEGLALGLIRIVESYCWLILVNSSSRVYEYMSPGPVGGGACEESYPVLVLSYYIYPFLLFLISLPFSFLPHSIGFVK